MRTTAWSLTRLNQADAAPGPAPAAFLCFRRAAVVQVFGVRFSIPRESGRSDRREHGTGFAGVDAKSTPVSVPPMRLLLAVAAVIFTWTALPASAAVVLSDDIGGKMEDYTSKFQRLRTSGEAVVIDGKCYSACTIVLGVLPPNRVCATPNAVFGFHAAWMYDTAGNRVPSPAGTKDLMKAYPASVRAWISRNGGLRSDMMYLQGRELAAVVRPCAAGQRTTSFSPAKRAQVGRSRAGGDAPHASFDTR